MKCPACGSDSVGRFCNSCGKPLTEKTGVRVSLPWAVAGAASLGFLVLLIMILAGGEKRNQRTPSEPTQTPAGAPPDISNMTPRERFDRLYNRVMAAADAGLGGARRRRRLLPTFEDSQILLDLEYGVY